MLNNFVLLIFSLFYLAASAQNYKQLYYIKAYDENKALLNPWMGGLVVPVMSKGDINFDGKEDIVVLDLNTGFVHGFLNVGINGSQQFKYDKNATEFFPIVNDWFLLRDYNCDGMVDLFTYGSPGSIAVYNGEKINNSLRFTQRYTELRHGNVAVYNVPTDFPTIEDLDSDGDLDILSFNVSGTKVSYYKNLQVDLGLSCDSLVFERVTRCWGGFEEGLMDEDITLNACNPALKVDDVKGILHVGGSVSVIDKKNNGKYDALVGDVQTNTVTYLTNGGTPSLAQMTSKDIAFPSNNIPVKLFSNPVATVMDVNMDGWDDILFTPFEYSGTDNYFNTWYYKNTGSSGGYKFELQTRSFLTENMFDFGQLSYPTLGDIDGDEKVDMLVGTGGLRKGADTVQFRLIRMKNIGTVDRPAFKIINSDFLNLSQLNFKNLAPDLKDMDGDGDLDLLIGLNDGSLIYFNNEGNFSVPNFIYKGKIKDNFGNDIIVGTNAMPEIYDIDKDNNQDIIIGSRQGVLKLYKGIGFSGGKPTFELYSSVFGAISFPSVSISAEVVDVDNDGKDDLLLSGVGDSVLLYSNIEDNWNSTLVSENQAFIKNLKHKNISLASAQLSSGLSFDIISGTSTGGLLYLSSNIDDVTALRSASFNRLVSYPNPVNHELFIDLTFENKTDIQLSVLDAMGKQVNPLSYVFDGSRIRVNTENLISGFYIIRIWMNKDVYFSKFIKQ